MLSVLVGVPVRYAVGESAKYSRYEIIVGWKYPQNHPPGYLCAVNFLTGVLLGLAVACGANLFPGMLNMTGVSVSLRAGRKTGYIFSAGMACALTSQAALAVFFANYLASHPNVLVFFRQWAVLLFLVLAVYFFFKGYRARLSGLPIFDRPYHGPPFLRGVMLALMNFLTVPYFFAVGGWLLSDGHLSGDSASRTAFILGAGAGAMLIFGGYVRLADWIHRKAIFLTRNINFVLSALLLILAVVQAMRNSL